MKKLLTLFGIVILTYALFLSVRVNYQQSDDILSLHEQLKYERHKFETFAFITGRIVNKCADISIDSLVAKHFVHNPYDSSGDGIVIDFGIKYDGIKYHLDSNGTVTGWEPYYPFYTQNLIAPNSINLSDL